MNINFSKVLFIRSAFTDKTYHDLLYIVSTNAISNSKAVETKLIFDLMGKKFIFQHKFFKEFVNSGICFFRNISNGNLISKEMVETFIFNGLNLNLKIHNLISNYRKITFQLSKRLSYLGLKNFYVSLCFKQACFRSFSQ